MPKQETGAQMYSREKAAICVNRKMYAHARTWATLHYGVKLYRYWRARNGLLNSDTEVDLTATWLHRYARQMANRYIRFCKSIQ